MHLLSSLLIGLLMLASPITGQTTAENGDRSGQQTNEQTEEEHGGDQRRGRRGLKKNTGKKKMLKETKSPNLSDDESNSSDEESNLSKDERATLKWTGIGFGVFFVIWTAVLGSIVWKREAFGAGQLLVVSFFMMFFLLIMFTTGAVWIVDIILRPKEHEHHVYEIFADGFKVTLGALIGVLTMWCQRSLKDETAR